MKFLNSIIFRIWFPLALTTVLAASVAMWYVSLQQRKELIGYKQGELRKHAAIVAEILSDTNTTGIPRDLLDSIASRAGAQLIISGSTPAGQDIIFASSAAAGVGDIIRHSEDYLIGEADFSPGFPFPSGGVRQLAVRLVVRKSVALQNLDHVMLPVVLMIASLAACCLLLFYAVARWISRPLVELKNFSAALLRQEYSQSLSFRYGLREVGELKDNLNRLGHTLDAQRTRNQELTSGLEFQVAKRTQELKTLIQRLNDAQNIALIGNFRYWMDHDTWEFSPNMEMILGAGSAKITGLEGMLLRVPADVRDQIRSRFNSAISGKTRLEIDFPLEAGIRPSGSWASIIGDCRLDPEARVWCISGTIQDISARHRIEDQIDRLSLVARLTPNGVIITDTSGVITWVNQGMSRLTGYDFEEMIGKTPRMFQSERTNAEVRARIARNLQERKSIREELENITKDKQHYWIELHIEPFYDSFGNLQGFLAIQVDITERKQSEAELQLALAKATELSEIKSRFVSMASHEFRTPLTTIMSSSELLTHTLENGSELNRDKLFRYVTRITGEADRLAGLINDVLILGRQEAGKIPFRPVETDVAALVKELIGDRQIVENDTRVVVIAILGQPRILCLDPTLIGQILTNLATNALKYSRGRPSPELIVDYREMSLTIVVKDHGIGIPEADQKHLFETFYRGANVENIPGTGLGLSIVKQFMDLHFGKINIESRENSGTSVTLEFVYEELRKICPHIA